MLCYNSTLVISVAPGLKTFLLHDQKHDKPETEKKYPIIQNVTSIILILTI